MMLRRVPRWLMASGCGLVISGMSMPHGKAAPRQETDQTQETRQRLDSERDQPAEPGDQFAEDELPALGLVVGSCPGNAACVLDTVWGSPASEADIRKGDYVIAIEGQEVSSPQQFCDVVSELDAGKKVNVKIWRRGQELQRQVTLASKAEERPEGQRAWLGVLLSSSEAEGVVIENVVPNSPADRAGLQAGDRVIKSDGHEVADVQSFVESIEKKGPESQVQLTIADGDQENTLSVQLGDVASAPMSFMRQGNQPSMDSMWGTLQSPPNMNTPMSNMPMGMQNDSNQQLTDATLDDLRQRIRQLERQVERLTGMRNRTGAAPREDRPANQNREQDREQSENRGAENNDNFEEIDDSDANLSQLDSNLLSPSEITFVAQRGDGNQFDRGNRGRDQRDRDQRGRDRRDFDRGRDFDRSWNRGRDYDWRDRYRSRYGSQLNQSPRYGNQYYRYGGRPYYYGNRSYGVNPYYNRQGFNFGNFGIYW